MPCITSSHARRLVVPVALVLGLALVAGGCSGARPTLDAQARPTDTAVSGAKLATLDPDAQGESVPPAG
jgi:hypothetical protein